MATYYNPKITINNLEFSADAANVKSWSGPIPGGPAYGYFGGGRPGPSVSTVDRIDYGNDTATAVAKGPLSVVRYGLAAIANSSYGYWGGGSSPSKSTVDRVDYSSDTPTAAVKGPLNQTINDLSATGTADYGYFVGGYLAKTYVDRIDYSNDTATATAKGNLSSGKHSGAGAGNRSYGYFGGGVGPTGSIGSTVDRIDYSNDTSTAAPKGPLSLARESVSATGNASYGWFGSGSPGPYSTVDRIDYGNDTATAAVKGPLATTVTSRGATGSDSYGYWGGGSPGPKTTTDRIDYSSDTPTASTKGPLSAARYHLAALSAQANALPKPEKNWNDMTGKGNDIDVLSATNPPTFSGLNGGVWDFDGSNDYMEKTSFSGVAFGTGDFAVETWVRVDNLTADHMIWETRSAASSTEDGLVFLAYGSNNDEWSVWTAGASKITGANSSVSADTWYHAIVTRISGTTTLYVNGVSIGSFSDSYNYTNDDLRIGKNVTSANYLDGKIALFRVYKAKGLTASEVLNNFNATRTRFGV